MAKSSRPVEIDLPCVLEIEIDTVSIGRVEEANQDVGELATDSFGLGVNGIDIVTVLRPIRQKERGLVFDPSVAVRLECLRDLAVEEGDVIAEGAVGRKPAVCFVDFADLGLHFL
jgi:hypothetical protein